MIEGLLYPAAATKMVLMENMIKLIELKLGGRVAEVC